MKVLLGWSLDGALDPWSCLSENYRFFMVIYQESTNRLITMTMMMEILKMEMKKMATMMKIKKEKDDVYDNEGYKDDYGAW